MVASIYPLAVVAQRLVPESWEVIDLTPSGVEAHDLELSLEQRAAIEDADLVLYLGEIGFQPQVESAVQEASGVIVGTAHLSGEQNDPHSWVDPGFIGETVRTLMFGLNQLEPDIEWLARSESLTTEAARMRARYQSLEVAECRFRTMIVTHEAFGVFSAYDIEQFGLSGIDPEAEPTAARLAEAADLVESGEAGAIFYDEHEDAKRVAESFGSDAGIPALSLSTIESRPAKGDYFTVLDDNLDSLKKGLRCR